MLLLLWPLLALWVAGASRRRARAVARADLEAHESDSSCGEEIAGGQASSAENSDEAPPMHHTHYGGYHDENVECNDQWLPASSSSGAQPASSSSVDCRAEAAPARLEALPPDMKETISKMVRSWAAIATLTVSVDEEGPHGWQSQGWEADPRPLARQDSLNFADLMYLVRQQLQNNLPPRLLEVAMDRLRQLVRAPTPGLSPPAEGLPDPPTPPVPGPNPYLALLQQSGSASDSLEEVQIDEADEAATLLAIAEDAVAASHEADAELEQAWHMPTKSWRTGRDRMQLSQRAAIAAALLLK